MMKKVFSNRWTAIWVALALFLIDFGTKAYFREKGLGIENSGISFGLFSSRDTWVIFVLELALCVSLTFLLVKGRLTTMGFWALALLLAGGLGNMISRGIWGNVWDWIHVGSLPYFNIADLIIDTGCLLFILDHLVIGRRKNTSTTYKIGLEGKSD